MTQLSLTEEAAKLAHDARETSRLAALKIAPRSGTIRFAVFRYIMVSGRSGRTDDEISEFLEISPNTIRPRRLELVEGGWVCEGNREAKSRYGNKAIAWVGTPQAQVWWATHR